MARVVQRRSTQPYLLIVFVFLFVISLILAVLQFVEADKARKQLATHTEMLNKLVTPQERERDAQVQKMIGEANGKNSVVSQYVSQIQHLTQLITGSTSSDFETVMADAQKAQQKAEPLPDWLKS
jgi:ABC-type dipeptide/oligopeptide/nickel transport system permease component